jgi:hypothetical protein
MLSTAITWHDSLYVVIPAIAVAGMFISIPATALRRGSAGRCWLALACAPAWFTWIAAVIWHQPIPALFCGLATCLACARGTWWGPAARRGRHRHAWQDPAVADLREWSNAALAALRSPDEPAERMVPMIRPRGDLKRERTR